MTLAQHTSFTSSPIGYSKNSLVSPANCPPDLDPAIAPLVFLLNELPGITTESSCQGHAERGDGCASVSLRFKTIAALNAFLDLLEFVTGEGWLLDHSLPEPVLHVALELDLGVHQGPWLLFHLILAGSFLDPAEISIPPSAEALAEFTAELRQRAARRFSCVRRD